MSKKQIEKQTNHRHSPVMCRYAGYDGSPLLIHPEGDPDDACKTRSKDDAPAPKMRTVKTTRIPK